MRTKNLVISLSLLSLLAFQSACDGGAQFLSTLSVTTPPAPIAGEGEATLTSPVTDRFELTIADGKGLIRQGPSKGMTEVYEEGSSNAANGSNADAWRVELKLAEGDFQTGLLGERALDFSELTGLVSIGARFIRADGRNGTVSRTVFVDAEPPKLSLLELATTPNGEQLSLYWSATDNYQLNKERSILYVCVSSMEAFLAKSFDDFTNIPDSCVILAKADGLHSKGSQFTITSMTIDGTDYLASQLSPYLFAEDMVGLSNVQAMSLASRNAAILMLDSSLKDIQFTNQASIQVPLSLALLERGVLTQVDKMPSAFSGFSLLGARQPMPISSKSEFNPTYKLELGTTDGLYVFKLRAIQNSSEVQSNERSFSVVLDRAAPTVRNVLIQVPNGVLDETTKVGIRWEAEDANGIVSQTIEFKSKGDSNWTKIAELAATQRELSIDWGNRPQKGFSIRISAKDSAGNVGQGQGTWAPQFFNAAVLTSSVECFYCHMQIEGDVAGINFPVDIHAESGRGFAIIGKLYSTNTVPTTFKNKINAGTMKVTGGFVENYDNSGVKIFPSQKDAKGIPVFPSLNIDTLKQRVNGTVINGNGTRYSRVYSGNLVLTGTSANPIVLNGEFLVEGDLVIKGVYKGIGSIYARNVYIPNDIVSIDCVPGSATCPFPFAGANEAEKIASAKIAIKQQRSALYLAATKQTVVGGISENWGFTLSNPYTWLPRMSYEALCTQAAYLVNSNGENFYTPEDFIKPLVTTEIRARCEVARVDAFIYGNDLIALRSYGNFLINGGFVGYKAALISTVPYRNFTRPANTNWPINPRNGMSAQQNVIRYDWRLRAGGPGFESLKIMFDQ